MITFDTPNTIAEIDLLERARRKRQTPVSVGGRGGGKGGAASNDANTYRSNARARMIEAISEGEIVGLVNGEKSIFFDQTPLQNEDGTYNFKEVIWSEHKGLADEGFFQGHSAVETPTQVEVQVKEATGPVQRTIVDENADAVRVIMRIPSLVKQDKKGGLKKTNVSYAIDVRGYNGTWVEALRNDLKSQKALSPFEIAHEIDLPHGGSPWDVRVRRLTPDSDDDKLQNDTFWEGYVVLVRGKFTYPHTAAIAMEVNAEEMGSSVPPRSYDVRGLIVNVPDNYDPETRAYSGIWNGTFKRAWTNNPAWVFYDLIVNDRYGLGEFVKPEIVDKWSLYTIAQYCDQLVPSGYKNGDTGADIMEPRFTYNGSINSFDEAFFVLQSISQAWRGMAYWALGQVFATADMPQDPVRLVTPANAVGGDFEYSGTAIKARHSVILVQWNDPDDFYRPSTEVVIDTDLLNKYGWRAKTVQLRGCTSRGLAHRYGKWIIDTEQHETDTLVYSASWDHAELRPGDIIAVSDPKKAQIRAGGRVAAVDDLEITLDAPFEWNDGETYSLMVTLPDGKLETRAILAFLDDKIVRVASAYSQEVVPDAVWTITGTDIVPRNYRVLDIEEAEPQVFKITALFHDPQKYGRVEQGIVFEPLPYERNSKTSIPPTGLTVKESGYTANGQTYQSLTVSWTPPQNFLTRGYVVSVDTPNDGSITLGSTNNTYFEMPNTEAGLYTFYVQTVSYGGVLSDPATIDFNAQGIDGFELPTVSDLELVDNPTSLEFTGPDCKFRWKNNFADSMEGTTTEDSPHYAFNMVYIYHGTTGALLRSERASGTTYTYGFLANKADCAAAGLAHPTRSIRVQVKAADIFGRLSAAAEKTFINPPPEAITPAYQVVGPTIFLGFNPPDDADFAGVIIHRSSAPGIDLETSTPLYDGTINPLTIPGEPDTAYYFRMAAYDVFGKDGLNWATEFSITTLSDGADVDPPAKPTGLAATSVLVNGRAVVTITWNPNDEDDLAGYDLQIKQGSGNWVDQPVVQHSFEFDAIAGTVYQMRVRARDKNANSSPYTDAITHTAIKDTVPPAVPTGLTIAVGLTSLWLSWTNPTDEDLDHIEVYENSVNNSATATLVHVTDGNSFPRTGLANEITRFYWVKAIDTSGNKSAFSAVISGTTAKLPEATRLQITGLVFTPNSPSANKVAWSSFSITYGAPGSTPETKTITAGNATWTAGSLYLYYVPGATTLATTTSVASIFVNGGLPVGVYRGGTDIQLTDGKVMMDGNNLLAGTVGAQQLVVNDAIITNSLQLADAIITSAKIIELEADKIKADTTLSNTIIVGGTGQTLATVQGNAALGAQDPAARINGGATVIQPGKVLISGATRLSNWISGTDSTKINAGAFEANSIKSNIATIGMRGINIDGVTFEHNSPSNNKVSWTTGTIAYTNDAGIDTTKAITAGNATWTAGTLWLYWVKDTTTIAATTNFAVANDDNNVVLASYKGGIWLFATYGRTVVDGGQIKTQSIDTAQLKVGAVTAQVMNVTSLSSISANMGTLTAGKAQSLDGKFVIDFTNKFISITV